MPNYIEELSRYTELTPMQIKELTEFSNVGKYSHLSSEDEEDEECIMTEVKTEAKRRGRKPKVEAAAAVETVAVQEPKKRTRTKKEEKRDTTVDPLTMKNPLEALTLALYRKDKTKKEFADMCGISYMTISLWFRNKKIPDTKLEVVTKYCASAGITVGTKQDNVVDSVQLTIPVEEVDAFEFIEHQKEEDNMTMSDFDADSIDLEAIESDDDDNNTVTTQTAQKQLNDKDVRDLLLSTVTTQRQLLSTVTALQNQLLSIITSMQTLSSRVEKIEKKVL